MTLRHLLHFSFSVLSFSAFTSASEPPLNDLLRQGLYAEEVTRDPAAAAAQYEQVLARFQGQQAIAATALFRLAEVRRQQDKKDDAIKLYQQLLTDFPKAEAEGKLARQHLTELGGKIPEAGLAVVDEEEQEIAQWDKLLATAPDLARKSGVLGGAANKGQLRVVRHLLKAGMDANVVFDTLGSASNQGYLEVVKAILELGNLPKSRLSSPLSTAVGAGNTEVVRALLNAGAGTDLQSHFLDSTVAEQAWYAGGTPLNAALIRGNSAVVDLLLAAKADPNLASEETGITPLHATVMSGVMPLADRAADLGKLLDHGANPNVLTKGGLKHAPEPFAQPVSPLQLALLYYLQWDCAKLLLRRGADPKQPGLFDPFLALPPDRKPLAMIQFLLENGADPNTLDAKGKPILRQVVQRGDAELLKLFLKHGGDAKVKLTGWKLRREVGHGDPFAKTTGKIEDVPGSLLDCVDAKDPKVALEITRLLLDAGAKSDGSLGLVLNSVARLDEDGALVRRLLAQRPDFLNLDEIRGLKDWQPASRRIFLDEVLIPALAKEPGLLLFSATTGVRQSLVTPATTPLPSTPALLLAKLETLLPEYREPRTNAAGLTSLYKNRYWPALTLIRPTANGGFERQALDLTDDKPLPELGPGDLLELAKTGELVQDNTPMDNTTVAVLKTNLTWHLWKRISFPVTVTLDGQAREFTLRGDLLTFDPTKPEAPLLTAGSLAKLLLPNLSAASDAVSLKENTILTVQRKGATDLRMDLSAPAAYRFELQAGDHLILPDSKSVMQQASSPGQEPIWLVTPGLPYRRRYETRVFDILAPGTPSQRTLPPPTLLQLLTDAYFPHNERSPLLEKNLDETWYPTLMKRIQTYRAPAILPHPDLSHIRIKRTGTDGKETVIEVNLTESIERCSDETSVADARKADRELQPGDVVELPLKTDQLAQPWAGFSAAEERFFRKALGGFYTLKTSDGIMEQMEILYHQPEWRQTPHGLLPLPPKQGVASTRANRVGRDGHLSKVVRGNDSLPPNTSFVRDGDLLLDVEGGRVIAPPDANPHQRVVPLPTGR